MFLAENFSFLGPIFNFGGIFHGLDVNFEFRFLKRFDPCVRLRCSVARENPPCGLTCKSVNKKRYIYNRKIFVTFHPFAEEPPMHGFARNFAQGLSRGRNHLFLTLCQSVEGFRICAGSNFAILPLLSQSPLTQGCATARL